MAIYSDEQRQVIGEMLRRRRMNLGLTAPELVDRLNAHFKARAHENHIYGYEGATKPISPKRLFELSQTLKTSMSMLMGEGPSHEHARNRFVQSMTDAFRRYGAEAHQFHELSKWPERLEIDLGRAIGPIQQLMTDVSKMRVSVEYAAIRSLICECILYLDRAYDARKRVEGSRLLLFDACHWLVVRETSTRPPVLLRPSVDPSLALLEKIIKGYDGSERLNLQDRYTVLEADVEKVCADGDYKLLRKVREKLEGLPLDAEGLPPERLGVRAIRTRIIAVSRTATKSRELDAAIAMGQKALVMRRYNDADRQHLIDAMVEACSYWFHRHGQGTPFEKYKKLALDLYEQGKAFDTPDILTNKRLRFQILPLQLANYGIRELLDRTEICRVETDALTAGALRVSQQISRLKKKLPPP